MANVDACDSCTAAQEIFGAVVQLAIHSGEDQSDTAFAFPEIARNPRNCIFGLRLDSSASNRFFLRYGRDSTKRCAAGEPARNLCGAENRRRSRNECARIIDESTELRLSSDSSRIEELHRVVVELENAVAFDEERSALFKERLERREIENGRICFYLTEVRIYGSVEREAG